MSSDQHKTKQELIDELNQARRRIAELEAAGRVGDLAGGEPNPDFLRWCNPLAQITEDALGILDADYIYQLVNPAYERFWGRPKHQLIGRSVPELFGDAVFAGQMKERLDRCLAGEVVRYSDWFESPALGRRCMDVAYQPLRDSDGQIIGLINLARDVTDQALAQEELEQQKSLLEQAKERLEQAIRSANVGLWDWDLITDRIHFSAEWAQQIGYAPEEIGDTLDEWKGRVHPDDLPKPLADAQAMLSTAGRDYEAVFRLRHKDGHYRWILSQATAHRDHSGKPVRVLGSHIDITRQKQLEQERLRLEAIAEGSPDFIGISDLDGNALYVNPAGRRLVGLTDESDITGIRIPDFLWPEDRASAEASMVELLRKSRVSREIRFRHFTDNRPIEMQVEAFRVDDPATGQPLFTGTVSRDVTERNRLTANLRQSERKFRSMVEFAPLGLAIVDPEGVLEECNKALADILGYSVNELLGKNFASFTHPDDLPREWGLINQMRENRIASYSLDKRYICKDGTLRWVRVINAPIPNKDTGQWCGLGFVEDITERKHAQQRMEKSQFILQEAEKLAGVGAWEWDIAKGKFFVSENWCSIHGTDKPAPDLQEILPIAHPEDRPAIEQAWADVLERGQDYVIEHRIVHQDTGELRHISAKGKPQLDESGQVARIYGVALDVTEQKRNEAALRQAKEQAEAASLAKSMFLANMSHELRTPLNGVLGMLQILDDAALEPALAEAVSIAIGSSQTLLTVINDILDFSKIEAGKLSLEHKAFDLNDLLQSVLAAFTHQAKSKALSLQLDIAPDLPARVVGDIARLRQVLFNLLGNAIKFTDRGEVRLILRALSATEQARTRLEFAVTDTGIGIPADRLADIFDSFSQVDDSSTRRFQGTGLGLAIVKRLVDLMGGQVEIASTPGQGTEVRFDISVGLAGTDQPDSRKAEKLPLQPRKVPNQALQILVVDDEPTNVKVLGMMLKKLGHQIDTAANGLQALDKLSHQHFDLVFMDASMPEMGGIEATQIIRNNKHGDLDPSVRIVALTANAMQGDREKYLAAGMDDYLAKPIDANALRDMLDSAMTQGRSEASP